MGTEDRELIEMFLEETRERLEAIEPALVELEQATTAAEREHLLNEIFRHLHSTKGSAEYLNLDDLVALVHAAEQLADVLRRGAPLQVEHIDLFLQATAAVKTYLVSLAGGTAAPGGLDALTAALQSAAAAAQGGNTAWRPPGRRSSPLQRSPGAVASLRARAGCPAMPIS